MRTLIVLSVLLVMAFSLVGCGAKDAHQLYTERAVRMSEMADSRMLVDDVNSAVFMDDRPSHLSMFAQE
jgi:uncharacterized protein YcfL